jgi:hypothetical protein
VNFVPIPTNIEALEKLFPLWEPFLDGISRRSKEPIRDLIAAVKGLRVQIALVWGDDNKPHALVGMQYRKRGDDLIGEICWLTGKGMKEWRHLLPQMEKYLKEEKGCVEIRPICRPGWSRFLTTNGFKTTHFVMEKKL